MATKSYRDDMKRRTVDPKLLRKGSRVVPESTMMHGSKEQTKTGYKSSVHLGKKFESFCEVILEGMYTDLAYHKTKLKTVRVISGAGFLITVNNPTEDSTSWVIEQTNLVPGDIVEFAPGKAYRMSTSAQLLELVVTQESGYDEKLIVVEATDSVSVLTEEMMHETTRHDIIEGVMSLPMRPKSKAREQLLANTRQGAGSAQPSGNSMNKNPKAELAALLSEDSAFNQD